MKKRYLWLCLVITSCSATQKMAVNNDQVFNEHTKPFKIFSVGYWPDGYMVVTFTDIHNEYFTVKTLADTSLKVGLVYNR